MNVLLKRKECEEKEELIREIEKNGGYRNLVNKREGGTEMKMNNVSLFTVCYMILIFLLSSKPIPLPEMIFDPTKFLLHVGEYSVLGFLLVKSLRNSKTSIASVIRSWKSV